LNDRRQAAIKKIESVVGNYIEARKNTSIVDRACIEFVIFMAEMLKIDKLYEWLETSRKKHLEEEEMTKSIDPFEKSAFTYSFFYGGCDDFFKLESEYNAPNYAESAYRYGLSSEDGAHKAYFGIYDRSEMDDDKWDLYADIWDKSHMDLVGCATIKDWEWLEVSGNETFDKGVILDCLNSELTEITEWIYAQGIRKE